VVFSGAERGPTGWAPAQLVAVVPGRPPGKSLVLGDLADAIYWATREAHQHRGQSAGRSSPRPQLWTATPFLGYLSTGVRSGPGPQAHALVPCVWCFGPDPGPLVVNAIVGGRGR
jgi:hypothetical protein